MGEKQVGAVSGGNNDNGAGAGGGGGGGGEGMHCPDHPYRSNPGGICAFCLQERLGKLVSSSTSFPAMRSSSSSSPYSSSATTPLPKPPPPPSHPPTSSRHRMLFLSSKKKRESSGGGAKLSRSSSVAPSTLQSMDSPRRRWFWFLQHHNTNEKPSSVLGETKDLKKPSAMSAPKRVVTVAASATAEEEGSNQTTPSSYGRKVSRSRSVGCGSRSFSGDFFERISTGLGDCALRRVESQREPKIVLHRASTSAAEGCDRNRDGHGGQRIRCGGIFGGFGISTPSSTSTYWMPSEELTGGSALAPSSSSSSVFPKGGTNVKGKGWAWAFTSPIRAFRTSSKTHGLTAGDDVAPTTPNGRVVGAVSRKSPTSGSSSGDGALSSVVVAKS